MSVPPRPANVVRMLSISLGVVVIALAGALFGVPMEAAAPATGVVTSDRLIELRARHSGLVEMKIRTGDELEAGRTIAIVRPEETPRPNEYWRELLPEWNREPVQRPESQIVMAPTTFPRWQLLETKAGNGQRVEAGELIGTIVPIDPVTKMPLELTVRLEFDEKYFGNVQAGQTVRFASAMYNYRFFGRASGRIDRLEPAGSEGLNGERRFFAVARVDQAPFEMKIGSSVKAEVVTGRRSLVRVILEH